MSGLHHSEQVTPEPDRASIVTPAPDRTPVVAVEKRSSETGASGQRPDAAELRAAAYLSRVAEPACIPLWLLVQQLGYIEAAELVRSGDVPAEVAVATEARRESADPDADLDAAERNDIRLITPASPDWPHLAFGCMVRVANRRCAEWTLGSRTRSQRGELIPPLALWVRGSGDLAAVGLNSVAVVGSRAASPYGEHVASEFAYGLASRQVVVVSGGAYGIDAAAHRAALAADGMSVLVSAGGLDRPYPAGNRQLYERTAETGVLVSERPPGSAPHRQRFLSRNRIIAALGSATLVIEAGQRSGALNSAGYARDLGRPVLAVPGPVTSAMSVGCHRLVQREESPAFLVTSVADVLAFCAGPSSRPSPVDESGAADTLYDGLSEPLRAVLDGFPARRVVTEAELARLSGQSLPVVLGALGELTMRGLVVGSRTGYRLGRMSDGG